MIVTKFPSTTQWVQNFTSIVQKFPANSQVPGFPEYLTCMAAINVLNTLASPVIISGIYRCRHTARGGERNAVVVLPVTGNVTPSSFCPRRGTSRRRHSACGGERHAVVILPAAGNVTPPSFCLQRGCNLFVPANINITIVSKNFICIMYI